MARFVYAPGDYLVQPTGQSLRMASTGKALLTLPFLVLGRSTPAGLVADCPQLPRSFRQVVDDTMIERLQANLKVWDLPPLTDIRQLMPGFPGAIDLLRKQIEMTCTHGDFNGKPAENWDIARNKLLSTADVEALQAQLGHLLHKGADAAPPTAPTSGVTSGAPAPATLAKVA